MSSCSGEELKKMFQAHGSFEAMEIQIKKKNIKTRSQASEGGWYSAERLKVEGWSKTLPQLTAANNDTIYIDIQIDFCMSYLTKQISSLTLKKMVEKAFAWAQSNNRIRTNEIHGEQEIQVVLNEKFQVSNTDVEEVERSGNITVQDIWFPIIDIMLNVFWLPALTY